MGTSCRVCVWDAELRDHPHAYGDKPLSLRQIWKKLGSSPRVWGQVLVRKATYRNKGIIPTRMGTSVVCDVFHLLLEDHPHAYGDKMLFLSELRQIAGSSPRVWGQARPKRIEFLRSRIIPTRMGTSCIFITSTFFYRDHPHAYGDKLKEYTPVFGCSGSSPRVWGQDDEILKKEKLLGIIPTRMGTSR